MVESVSEISVISQRMTGRLRADRHAMKKLILPGAIGLSGVWVLGVLAYITVFFGWQNITYLLPS